MSRTHSSSRALLRGVAASCLALLACSGAPPSGPVKLTWDRDTCSHCYMTIGDRRAAAQLRVSAGDAALLFDDLGCALLQLGDRDFAELWVRNSEGTDWIDAREARFASGASTPMDYGFVVAAEAAGPATGNDAEMLEALPLSLVRTTIREIEDERRSARR